MNGACEPRVVLLGPELVPTEGVRLDYADGRIAAIGDARGDPEAEARDLVVMPGFIDAHVHIGFVSPAEVLKGGVTTVRDLAWPEPDIWPLVEQSRAPGFDGPSIFATGPMLTVRGGYPTRAAWAPPGTGIEVEAEDEARAAVARLLRAGACAIKVALNAAAGPTLPLPRLRTIVEAAHERGLKVTGHVTGLAELEKAIEAGLDELAHMLMSDESIPDSVLEEMVRSGMTIVPTLSCRYGHGRELAVDNLRRFIEAGGRVVYGTDLGNAGPQPGIDPLEVKAMAEAGMTSLDIIRSATVASAAWLGLDDRGVIAEGRRWDLVGVPVEALSDPVTLTRVGYVARAPG